ncbi:MAG: SPOR domain-containing protein [Bacteroidetes bacterium]|nr:SPOR domain-containing protein [Fibrella sp.]
MEPRAGYTVEDKLRCEIEKLEAETANLKRTWIDNPASWVTILTTIVALGGVALQYTRSDREYQLVQIKTERLALDTIKLRDENAKLSVIRQQLQDQVKLAQNELVKLNNKPDSLRAGNAQLQESEDTFSTLGAALKNGDSTVQFVSVIATLRKPDLANRRAKGLKLRGIDGSVEVYRKAPGQYALTLGGKSTYTDATRRVEYAKQNGFPDAVVRLAKNWGENLNK